MSVPPGNLERPEKNGHTARSEGVAIDLFGINRQGQYDVGMGIYDRDYYRDSLPRAGFGHFVAWSVTTWLIVINVVVFFADTAMQRIGQSPAQLEDGGSMEFVMPRAKASPLTRWGAFSVEKGIQHCQIWRIITYQFLHDGPWHLLFNMLGLYFFGPIVEAHFGSRRYLAFYLLCGAAGALTFSLLVGSHFLPIESSLPLVGASGSIFGLLVASAMIAPSVQVFYYFFPVTILMLAVGGMLLAFYTVLATTGNAGGQAAHLGGGILGFVLMKNPHVLNVFAPAPRRTAAVARPRRRVRMAQKDWSKDLNR